MRIGERFELRLNCFMMGLVLQRMLAAGGTFVVLLALLLRAAIPDGFMPARDDRTGTIEITLCSAGHAEAVRVPLNAPDRPAPSNETPDCVFALTAGAPLAALPGQVPTAATVLVAKAIGPAPVFAAIARSPIFAHAPHTGPPARG
jgi:hypothetical protein